MRLNEVTPIYVENIPEEKDLEEGKLYIATEHGTAIHLCCCGCGNQVVTPLSEGDWQLTDKYEVLDAEGGLVTLRPSIGNYQFPCKSHYLVTDNKIQWL